MRAAAWIPWVLLAIWWWHLWPVWFGLLHRRRLIDVPPLRGSDADLPAVSIIVPSRDEAAAVEPALRSMLAIDYPHLEVIAIDDRSTDGTGAIMDRLAAADPRCQVIHVTALSPGWLGKNHANMLGVRQARGELLLFTDGDVVFQPAVLRHAVAHLQARGLDHLAVIPRMPSAGFWQNLMMTHFIILFTIWTRGTLARFRWARSAHMGVGAFNLVRRSAYEHIGTHERLRLEVADDVMLGKLVKQAGLRQDVLAGEPLVEVEWQRGARGIIRGLEKNAFAGARFSLPLAALATVLQLALASVPIVLAITGPVRAAWLAFVITSFTTFAAMAWSRGYSPSVALFYPVAGFLFAYTLARSMWVTLRSGGITWRGTFYPLAELRAGLVENTRKK